MKIWQVAWQFAKLHLSSLAGASHRQPGIPDDHFFWVSSLVPKPITVSKPCLVEAHEYDCMSTKVCHEEMKYHGNMVESHFNTVISIINNIENIEDSYFH